MWPANWDAYWPVRTKPLADESFVSWFCRLAWSNGLDAQSLYDASETDGNFKRRDLDRFPNPLSIIQLAVATGADAADLSRRTLERWCGTVTESIDATDEIPWLPRAGMRKESRAFGQQACVSCLREQPTPYLRQRWRLAFLTVCENHGELLIDRCPKCGAPIQPVRLQSCTLPICTCWACGADLRNGHPTTVKLTRVDRALLEPLETGWGMLPGYGRIHSIAFFRIFWTLYRLVAVGPYAKPLQRRFRDDKAMPRIPRTDSFYRLAPAYRRNAVEIAWRLLSDWPHTMVKTSRDLGIRSGNLLSGTTPPPFALWEAVNEHLITTPYTANQGEIAAAKRFLEKRGIVPAPSTMSMLVSSPTQPGSPNSVRVRTRAPFGYGRSWKLEGVSTETRLAALAAARADGMKLGHWVEQALISALARE